MSTDTLSEGKILDSWHLNAGPWTRAVRQGEIASRVRVTNHAIVEAVLACAPATAIDLGCGEGWLTRALCAHGIVTTGVDGVAQLIDNARSAVPGDFQVLSYEEIVTQSSLLPVDLVVCNFSLLGEASVERLLQALPSLLNEAGSVLVQTLHPLIACGEQPYRDGWRSGSWAGFGEAFKDPAPWYFRTLESWVELFGASGLPLKHVLEPLDPLTGKPLSLILVAQV